MPNSGRGDPDMLRVQETIRRGHHSGKHRAAELDPTLLPRLHRSARTWRPLTRASPTNRHRPDSQASPSITTTLTRATTYRPSGPEFAASKNHGKNSHHLSRLRSLRVDRRKLRSPASA